MLAQNENRIDYKLAKRYASYYLSVLNLGAMSEYDDVVQEIAIAMWQGRRPFFATVDYLRSKTFVKRHQFWAGVRVYLDDEKHRDDLGYNEHYDDYVFLSRIDIDYLKLAAHKEISSYQEQMKLRGGISESRVCQISTRARRSIAALYSSQQ